MKNRKFLVPFAALAASFAASQASATINPATTSDDNLISTVVDSGTKVAAEQKEGDRMKVKAGEDVFSFVLKKNDYDLLVIAHESHWSHSSHGSHSSHQSHYSGY